MNCLPGMPCWQNSSNPIDCNKGLTFTWFPCGCSPVKVNSVDVIYTGPDLTNSGIDTNDNLTLALAKLDAAIISISGAVPPTRTITINGVTQDLSANRTWNTITLTSFSGGTGISYNNVTGVITNSAPDQTVTLTQGANITITGSYPNFTIAASGGGTTTNALTVDNVTLQYNSGTTFNGSVGKTISVKDFGIDLSTKVTGILPPLNGGTGNGGIPANGDIMVGGGGVFGFYAIGSEGSTLTVIGGAVAWQNGGSEFDNSTPISVNNTKRYWVSVGAGAVTYNLPAINATYNNFPLFIKNAATGNMTINRASTNHIYDTASVTSLTLTPGQSVILLSDGTGIWFVIAH